MGPEDGITSFEQELTRRALLKYGAALGGATLASNLGVGSLAKAAAAVAAQPPRGGTIKLGLADSSSADTLDPAISFTFHNQLVHSAIYDNLVNVDWKWRLLPGLAEDWSVNSDATEWVFKLRRGVEFHSGKTFTAQDVADEVRRVINPKTGATPMLYFAAVDPRGIVIRDPTTIRFRLKKPDAFLAHHFGAWHMRIPQGGVTKWLGKASPGTGPFKNVDWRPGQGFELVRYGNYWQSGKPYLDGITGVALPEEATRVAALMSGDVDIVDSVTVPSIARIQSSRSAKVLTLPGRRPMAFDIPSEKGPYRDPKVRQAIKLAYDREKAVKVILQGHGRVGTDFFLDSADPFNPRWLKPPPFDPERAKTLLKQAGYSSGWTDVVWTTSSYPYLPEASALLQEGWKAAGIGVSLRPVSNNKYAQVWVKKQNIVPSAYAHHFPTNYMDFIMHSKAPFNAGTHDPQLDALIDKFKSSVGRTNQMRALSQVIRYYQKISAEMVVFQFDNFYGYNAQLGNVSSPSSEANIEFRSIYLNK